MTPRSALGQREHELLALAARPMTAKEIANETGLSVGTVNNYLSNAQRRMGARNRTEAVRMFREHNRENGTQLHSQFQLANEVCLDVQPSLSELAPHPPIPTYGLADSVAPRSRASLEAFLDPVTVGGWELPRPASLDWQKRLYTILILTIVIAFAMAAVVILLDALTRFTSS
ncbi:helix-turn-helix domain-containing protein [Sandarakinorhabdus rubra]|uniref:helix-turn-helix domain-containing protein n=1 Tax=Sandarakinorhabdus rubra TaxID=2672568 RepID=UPI0013DC4323|nr:helix-turn-helix transcriptional regulator [Sandarakinorhabdus rubra]